MSLTDWFHKASRALQRAEVDRELGEELRFHVERRADGGIPDPPVPGGAGRPGPHGRMGIVEHPPRKRGRQPVPARVRPGPSSREQKSGSYTKAVQTSRGRKFIQEVVAEMKKVTWPNRQELLQATLVVLVAVAIMALFLGVADQISERITDWIFPK